MNFSLHYLAVRQAVVSLFRVFIHRANLLAYLGKLITYTTENGFQGAKVALSYALLQFFSPLIVRKKKKLREQTPTKTRLCVLSIINQCTITCVGTTTIRLHSIKSSPPSLSPLCHSRDKLFLALFCLSVLQVTGSWAVPGNEAM